jgi:type I restriction enzyme S subunit
MVEPKKIGSFVKDYTKGITPKYVEKSTLMVLNQKCIRHNGINYALAQYCDESKKPGASKIVKVGDILINSTGQGTAGRTAFVREIPEGVTLIVDSHILIIRTQSYDEARCISYLLYFYEKEIQTFIDGSTGQGELDRVRLFNLKIPLPSDKNIQKKTGEFLDLIDSKIQLNQKISKNLEILCRQIYEFWFLQFDFPINQNKTFRHSGGELVFNEKLKRSIPIDWRNGCLSDLGSVVGGSTPPKNDYTNFDDNGYPWITPKDLSINSENKFISKGEVNLSIKGRNLLKTLPKGSVLLSSRAPIGYIAIASNDLTTNQGFKSFVPDGDFSTEFIYYAIMDNIPKIVSHASGSTFKEISGSVLKDIEVTLPSVRVVEEFTKLVRPNFELQEKIEIENSNLMDLRNWLLPALMSEQIKFN